MPLADLSNNVQLYYEDSGPPAINTAYPTVVCLHGYIFSSHVFSKCLPLAAPKGLRIITVNRRSYRHSTPLPENTWQDLGSKHLDMEHYEEFFRARAEEIAELLTYFHKELDVSNMSLLGWSLGNQSLCALLAFADQSPVYAPLKDILSGFILLDAPICAIGYREPIAWNPGYVHFDTEEERSKAFGVWVTGYFDHDLESRDDHKLDQKLENSVLKRPTIEDFTPADLEQMLDLQCAPENVFFREAIPLGYFKWQALKAFSNQSASPVQGKKISQVYGERSNWDSASCFWTTETYLKELGSNGRQVDFVPIEGANHFVQWDEPERFVDILKKLTS